MEHDSMKYLVALCLVALPLVSALEPLPENQPLPEEMFIPSPDGPRPVVQDPPKELQQ